MSSPLQQYSRQLTSLRVSYAYFSSLRLIFVLARYELRRPSQLVDESAVRRTCRCEVRAATRGSASDRAAHPHCSTLQWRCQYPQRDIALRATIHKEIAGIKTGLSIPTRRYMRISTKRYGHKSAVCQYL